MLKPTTPPRITHLSSTTYAHFSHNPIHTIREKSCKVTTFFSYDQIFFHFFTKFLLNTLFISRALARTRIFYYFCIPLDNAIVISLSQSLAGC